MGWWSWLNTRDSYRLPLKSVTLGPRFSFAGSSASYKATLPTPSGTGYTGKWVCGTGGTPYTPSELITAYDGATMAGTWVWEVEEASPIVDHASLSDYTIAELKSVADDLSANGTSSQCYARMHGFLESGAEWNATSSLRVRIIGICHDDKADGSGKAGLTLMASHCLSSAQAMTASNASRSEPNGWSGTALRAYLNSGGFWTSLPSDLQAAIETVNKPANNASAKSTAITDSADSVWLLSLREFLTDDRLSAISTSFSTLALTYTSAMGSLYEYFDTTSYDRMVELASCKKHDGSALGEASDAWTRTRVAQSIVSYATAKEKTSTGTAKLAVVPCFCL